ncbi:TRAP transporter small permease [Vibrio sp. WJH972]
MAKTDTGKYDIGRWVDVIMNRVKSASGSVLFLLMVGLIALLGTNIVLRYWFDSPISWSNTISRYIYIVIVLVGSAIAYIDDGHARVDILYDRVSPKARKVFDFIHCLIMIALCLIFMVIGTEHAISMWSVHPPIISWFPIGSVYLSIPLFAFLIFLYLLRKLISLFSPRSIS